jgi:hypothetical protein
MWADVQNASSNPRWELVRRCSDGWGTKAGSQNIKPNAPNELRTLDRQERIRAREAYATDAGSAVPLHDFCLEHSLYIRDRISKDDRFHM